MVLSLGDGGGRLGRRDVTGCLERQLRYVAALVSRIVTGSWRLLMLNVLEDLDFLEGGNWIFSESESSKDSPLRFVSGEVQCTV